MKLNLTWWRKRPSVHVADDQERLWALQNERLIGMRDMSNAIFMLDADTSHFTTMLDRLSNPGYVRLTLNAPLAVGSFIEHEGKIHRVETCERELSDDWFAPDRWVVGVRKPWIEKPEMYTTTFRWLEDEFMPRSKMALLTGITG